MLWEMIGFLPSSLYVRNWVYRDLDWNFCDSYPDSCLYVNLVVLGLFDLFWDPSWLNNLASAFLDNNLYEETLNLEGKGKKQ